ncbi:transcriptional regulator [Paenibacillus sp. LMG 31456]|uniref:Transcriptional regulator n=1 Tax=Paenibacillus foliorum TaxID=2654974 RepID=A0A972K4A9_9BACL|nr:transcriptional regulator [Paenibacillus foliorum]
MKNNETKQDAGIRTRKAITNILKQHGPADAGTLASMLEITTMAIRQHLYSLQEEALISYREEARPMGRPAKLWELTPLANKLFPDGYADLTVSLIESMKEAFGDAGLERLLEVRNKKQLEHYQNQIPEGKTVQCKLEILADIRTQEGYMAEVKEQEDGGYLLIEKHCPICEAAAVCTGLCQNEMNIFQSILGEQVNIERVEHILAGKSRCVYNITEERASLDDKKRI